MSQFQLTCGFMTRVLLAILLIEIDSYMWVILGIVPIVCIQMNLKVYTSMECKLLYILVIDFKSMVQFVHALSNDQTLMTSVSQNSDVINTCPYKNNKINMSEVKNHESSYTRAIN